MTVSGKGLAYSAVAQYQQAATLDSVSGIGEKLARLQEAVQVMDQCANYLPSSSSLLKERDVMRSVLERTTRDNNFIVSRLFVTMPCQISWFSLVSCARSTAEEFPPDRKGCVDETDSH
jgi:hypothetical protein